MSMGLGKADMKELLKELGLTKTDYEETLKAKLDETWSETGSGRTALREELRRRLDERSTGLFEGEAYEMAVRGDGRILVASSAGLYLLDPDEMEVSKLNSTPCGLVLYTNAGSVLIADDRNVYRSTDGGRTFTKVFTADVSHLFSLCQRRNLLPNADPHEPIFLAPYGSGGDVKKIWVSHNDGQSWEVAVDMEARYPDFGLDPATLDHIHKAVYDDYMDALVFETGDHPNPLWALKHPDWKLEMLQNVPSDCTAIAVSRRFIFLTGFSRRVRCVDKLDGYKYFWTGTGGRTGYVQGIYYDRHRGVLYWATYDPNYQGAYGQVLASFDEGVSWYRLRYLTHTTPIRGMSFLATKDGLLFICVPGSHGSYIIRMEGPRPSDMEPLDNVITLVGTEFLHERISVADGFASPMIDLGVYEEVEVEARLGYNTWGQFVVEGNEYGQTDANVEGVQTCDWRNYYSYGGHVFCLLPPRPRFLRVRVVDYNEEEAGGLGMAVHLYCYRRARRYVRAVRECFHGRSMAAGASDHLRDFPIITTGYDRVRVVVPSLSTGDNGRLAIHVETYVAGTWVRVKYVEVAGPAVIDLGRPVSDRYSLYITALGNDVSVGDIYVVKERGGG